ncbi:MAG: RNA polymerase sigma factor [Nevskiales bacterium]
MNAPLDAFLAGVERRALRMAEIATHDREEALDIVQDAMLRFVGHYRGRQADEWPPLFYRVLENRITDWHRSRKTRGRWWSWLSQSQDHDERDEYANIAGAASDDPLHAVQRGNAMSRLESALRALPQRQQQVFLLRVWEGLDVADTARVMGCGQGSVKTHLSRTLARLRAELGEEWP